MSIKGSYLQLTQVAHDAQMRYDVLFATEHMECPATEVGRGQIVAKKPVKSSIEEKKENQDTKEVVLHFANVVWAVKATEDNTEGLKLSG